MGFQGNVNLNKSGEQFEFTTEQIQEIIKCKNDPIYFIKNYIYIVNLDKGKIKFDLYPFQEKLINIVHNENRVIAKIARQSGKCQSYLSLINIKKDGKIYQIKIGDFYKWQKFLQLTKDIVKNVE